jgi:hypothetical protein
VQQHTQAKNKAQKAAVELIEEFDRVHLRTEKAYGDCIISILSKIKKINKEHSTCQDIKTEVFRSNFDAFIVIVGNLYNVNFYKIKKEI